VFDVLPAGAHFVLTTAAGDTVTTGTVPVQEPLVLPVGEYALHVSERYCFQFNGSISIKDGEQQRAWARLVCGPSSR
jgi:hypothetical protein